MADNQVRRAAYSVTGKRKSPLGWLPWALLLLLLLVALGVLLIVRNVSDDGDDAGLDVTDEPAAAGQDVDSAAPDGTGAADGAAFDAAATPAVTSDAGASTGAQPASTSQQAAGAAAEQPTTTAAGGSGSGSGAAAAPASSLTAGGQAILPVPAAGLGGLADQPVVGTAVTVESVVADEGFWVGTSPTDRVFVFLTPEARSTTGESPFQVAAGQAVNLQGTLIALAEEPVALGVDDDEGADQLAEQGHLVEATAISLG